MRKDDPMFNIKIDDNLELRLRGMEDAQAFFELTDRNRQYLRPWFPWVDATQTAANTSAYLEKCQTQFEKGESLDLGILYKGEWVGSVGFNGIDKENRKAE